MALCRHYSLTDFVKQTSSTVAYRSRYVAVSVSQLQCSCRSRHVRLVYIGLQIFAIRSIEIRYDFLQGRRHQYGRYGHGRTNNPTDNVWPKLTKNMRVKVLILMSKMF